jgi:hypothetical protein
MGRLREISNAPAACGLPGRIDRRMHFREFRYRRTWRNPAAETSIRPARSRKPVQPRTSLTPFLFRPSIRCQPTERLLGVGRRNGASASNWAAAARPAGDWDTPLRDLRELCVPPRVCPFERGCGLREARQTARHSLRSPSSAPRARPPGLHPSSCYREVFRKSKPRSSARGWAGNVVRNFS